MFLVLISLVLILVTSLLFLIKKQYHYWDESGVPALKATIPFGNLESVAKNQNSFGTAIYDLYRNSKDKVLGIYLFFKPALLIRDPILIKNVLTTDFEYFHDRGVYIDAKRDPMSANLFAMEGEDWKNLRHRLTPAFTSGKLKGMFDSIKSIGDHLVEHLQTYADKSANIELRDFASRYVADCLASVAFGLEGVSCIDNPEHEFKRNANQLNESRNIIDIFRRSSVFICPSLIKILRLKGLPKFMRKFCLDMVTNTINQREGSNLVKKDLIQFLIQLRNNSKAEENDWNIKTVSKAVKSLSFEEIASNVFVFYIAGTDSSSSTTAYTLYELTQNKDLMERAKKDIQETLERHDGKVTYESIMDMKFIDLCVKETLRKYPGLPILNRQCKKDYKVPDMDFTIQKGTSVIISLLGISRDEKYFKDAEKYNPDRFTEERSEFFDDMYIPFGVGPRSCIAFRMGLLIVKVAVVLLLQNFNFEALSIKELEFDYGQISLLPKQGECIAKITK